MYTGDLILFQNPNLVANTSGSDFESYLRAGDIITVAGSSSGINDRDFYVLYVGHDSTCSCDYLNVSPEVNFDYADTISITKIGSIAPATTTVRVENVGDVSFGLGIIIALLSLMFIGFIWNSINKKKPWQK